MINNRLLPSLILLLISIISFSQVVNNESELNSAISNASAGSTITLANGTWNDIFIDIDKNGTSSLPITITAQTPQAVFMTGNSRVYMKGSYLTISGLIFKDPANLVTSGSTIEPVFELDECNNCKIINNKIESYNGTESEKALTFKWILTDGQYNEIAYNSFTGKYGVGSIINDNRNSTEPDYLKIHHNYFEGRTPINDFNDDNDQDAIRLGNSGTSLDDSFSEVYENYFSNFFGEVEVISNKSGQNKYYNNTFRNYSGSLTLRHGNDCEVYGNYFFAENNPFSAGIRVIGENHKIYNNYIDGINSIKYDGSLSSTTGGINVSNGRENSELNGYYQVKNTQIVNNTFVNCDYALRIGTEVQSDLDQEPENLTVANNLAYNTSVNTYQTITTPSGSSVSEGNILSPATADLSYDGSFYRLTAGSSSIDASIGSYSFLTQDILEGARDANADVGAEEYGANGTHLPYVLSDVGVNIGFGSTIVSDPTLEVNPAELNYGLDAGSLTFDIIANVDWVITTDMPWLTLDITSGSGNTTIIATATENTTGAERSGTITVDEITGGSNLTTAVSVIQSNSFTSSEIPITATTSVGMQISTSIAETNAYNDDTSNYWTGNPDTDAEVSITFDLTCSHLLSEIGINFWKADERTTTFSIAVAENAAGPFTTIINSQTSAASGVTVNTEQLFSLNGVIGRYVKFIGIGNSSSSNWTSIANVNIYGNNTCEPSLSVIDNELKDSGISIFPIPVKNGALTISSKTKKINTIKIYSITGQLVLSNTGNNLQTKQINVTNLKSGLYFIELEGIGVAKFVIN